MDNPKISIIVPVYNAEKYIRRCVDSILKQTFTDFELLLVDDGSIDKSGEICDQYAISDDRINVVHKENCGVSSARNIGLSHARGEWVSFIDSDDWIENDYLEIQTNSPGVDFVISKGLTKYGTKTERFEQVGLVVNRDFNIILNGMLRPNRFFSPPWGRLFKTSIIKANNITFLPISYAEDECFNLEYLKYCKSSFIVEDYGYHYELNESSLTHSVKPWQQYVLFLSACSEYYKWYSERYTNLYEFSETMVEFHIVCNSLLVVEQLYKSSEKTDVRLCTLNKLKSYIIATGNRWKHYRCDSIVRNIKNKIILTSIRHFDLIIADFIIKTIYK